MLDEEDGNAVVGSPRGKQGISLVKFRVHYTTSKNHQADDEPRRVGVERARRLHPTFDSINQVKEHAPRGPVQRLLVTIVSVCETVTFHF